MAARRFRRRKAPHNIEKILTALGAARNALTSMNAEIIIISDLYRTSNQAIDAIDKVAEELTGDKKHFTSMLK